MNIHQRNRISIWLLMLATVLATAWVCIGCGGGGGNGSEFQTFHITSTVPANGAINVSTSSQQPGTSVVTATFSTAIDPSSINSDSFYASSAAGRLAEVVSYSNNVATVTFTSPLPQNTKITATVTTAVMNEPIAHGVPTHLGQNYVWTFTTGANVIRPTVVSTSPTDLATGVSPSTSVSATFSETMNADSLTATTFALFGPSGSSVSATVTYANDVATLAPTNALSANTVYTATLTTGVKDLTGTPLAAAKKWTFKTAAADIRPTVVSTVPAPATTGVSISSKVTATFSEAMNPASITGSTFTLNVTDGAAVPATVTYSNDVATLDPTTPLLGNTIYTAQVNTGVTDVAGSALVHNKTWTFTTALTDIAPTVVSTVPAANAIGISISSNVSVTFSESMAASSINGTTFTLMRAGGTAVPAAVTYANDMGVLNPTVALIGNSVYTATVTTGVQDIAGTPMAAAKTWTFTTASTDVAPTIVSTIPAASAINVAVNSTVSATFSEAMTSSSINGTTVILNGPNGLAVPAAVTYANNVATLTPTAALAGNAVYSATVNTGVKDVAGTPLAAAKTWKFTTIANGAVPTVISTNPASNATNVLLNQAISATFSEPMLASSLNTTSFTVNGVTGSVTYFAGSNIASFQPSSNLSPNTTYTAQIQVWAQDLKGNDLTKTYTWSFTTGTQLGQTGINLGSASTYGVLAGSTVTNGGPTVVNGNLGVSPGSAVTGFPPGTITGTLNAGNAVAAKAKADLLQGETQAAGLLGAQALPGDLSGLTIYPGLYNNSTSVMVSTGNVTFDAQGDPDAVFILQMGSTLTTGTGTGVVLAGGAQPGNIYWSVGSSATLGVNSSFAGVLLSQVSITANTGCTIQGVLLTNTGAVTLESNTVTVEAVKRGPAARKRT